MIPIRDTQRSRRRPVVNWAIILINIAVFAYELTLTDRMLESFIVKWGVIPAVITSPGLFPKEVLAQTSGPVGLFTSLFIHMGWVHMIGNMLYLFIFGDNVEDLLGHGRYLLFYLVSGVFASLAHIMSNPTSTVPTVGASGAIAGVLGAYFVNFPRSRVLALIPVGFFLPMVEVPSIVFLFLWFFTNLLSGVASLGVEAQGGVAWWAHIGGFVVGMFLSIIWRRRRQTVL
ncbi:MAG TPA: rhomboid family intramembrane serine protease [Firmicutes bacterium]|uniref:Rhomboid family intramembrane serine protease n=1 Tax=Candidatus Fermentithermobacillus carboniphilus TaxID=3085328 RepID=A0AAT9LBI3_9FIRM|nr:MAG: rhomboid family intramembrane serine protease [Candidatus Fermentithermobacillus carboniphilus]HHW17619.1 rhomboid family intramembrane serine protease [Candidatus Fermentithermobacillaceae bacterium]